MKELCGEYPVSLLCEALEFPRSSFYYRAKDKDDPDVIDQILSIAAQFPRYGYRRITAELRRRGYRVNHKKVLRIMRKKNLLVRPFKRPRTTTPGVGDYPNLVKGLVITRPNQVWCGDIAYIKLKGGFVYLAFLMDAYTKAIRGWELSPRLDEELVVRALERALQHAKPQIHHSDHGVQYLSDRYVALLEQAGVKISMAGKGRAWENGYAERFIKYSVKRGLTRARVVLTFVSKPLTKGDNMRLTELSQNEQERLLWTIKHSRDAKEVKRAQALLWLSQGESVTAVALRQHVSRQTVYNWIEHFKTSGRLCDLPRSGRPSRKRDSVKEVILEVMGKDPREFGYLLPVWTTSLLKAHMSRQGVEVSTRTIRRALRDLGYRYKRPRYVLSRRSAHWRQGEASFRGDWKGEDRDTVCR